MSLWIAVLGGVWAGPVAGSLAGGSAPASVGTYVVRQGDTLWSIAEQAAPGRDPRPMVDAIQAANGLDPMALVPGQTLVIPAGV